MKSPCTILTSGMSCIKADGKACKEELNEENDHIDEEEEESGLQRSVTTSNDDRDNVSGETTEEMSCVNGSDRSNNCQEGDEAEGDGDELEEYESAGGQDLLVWEDDQHNELHLSASSQLSQVQAGDQHYQIYKCPLCDYNTVNIKYYRRHLRQHSADTLRCPFCLYESKIKYHMDRHIRSHTGAGLAKCKFCNFQSVRTDVLRSHMRVHDQEDPVFSCNRCEFTSSRNEELKWHSRTHLEQKVFTCTECSYSTIRRGHMNRHMSNHQRNLLQCPCCEYSTRKFGLMSKHIENHKKIGVQIYFCSGCRYISIKAKHYKRHLESHRHKCSLCPFTTSRREFLYKHIDVKHKGSGDVTEGVSGTSHVNGLLLGEDGRSDPVPASGKETSTVSPDKVVVKMKKFSMIRKKSKRPAMSLKKEYNQQVVPCNVVASNEIKPSTNLLTKDSNEDKLSSNLQTNGTNETPANFQTIDTNENKSSSTVEATGSASDTSDALTDIKDPSLIKREPILQIDSCGDFDAGENIADHLDVLITATDEQRAQHEIKVPDIPKKSKPSVSITSDIPMRRNAPRKSKTRFKIKFKSMFSSLMTKSSKTSSKLKQEGAVFAQRRSLDGKFYRKPLDIFTNSPVKRKAFDCQADEDEPGVPTPEEGCSRASSNDDAGESPLHKYLKLSSNKKGRDQQQSSTSALGEPRAKKSKLEALPARLTPMPIALASSSSPAGAPAKVSSSGPLGVFSCSLCKFKTTTKKYLNRHIRRHERNASQLTAAAVRGEELEGLQHSCPVCPFSTVQKGLLIEHMSVHLREQSRLGQQRLPSDGTTTVDERSSLGKQDSSGKACGEVIGEGGDTAVPFVRVKQEPPDDDDGQEGCDRKDSRSISTVSNCDIKPNVTEHLANLIASGQCVNKSELNQLTPETLTNLVQLLVASRVTSGPQDVNPEGQPSTSSVNSSPLESNTSSLPLYTQLSLLANLSASTPSVNKPSGICPSAYEGIPEGTHVSLSGEEVVYSCGECSYTTTRKDHLMRHRNQHTGKGMQYCPHCPYSTVRKEHMKRHVKLHVEGVLKCPQCDFETRRKEQMRLHELSHLDKDHLSCPHCSYITLRKEHLKRHLNRHCVVRAAQCRHCSYTTDRRERMIKHAEGLHPAEGGVEEVFKYIDTEQGLLTDAGARDGAGSCAASVDGSETMDDSRGELVSPISVKVEPLDPCDEAPYTEAAARNAATDATKINTEHDSYSEECCALNFVDTCLADSDQDESEDSFPKPGQHSRGWSAPNAASAANNTQEGATNRKVEEAYTTPKSEAWVPSSGPQDVVIKKEEVSEDEAGLYKTELKLRDSGEVGGRSVGYEGDDGNSPAGPVAKANNTNQSCVADRGSFGGPQNYPFVPSDAEKLAKARAEKLILAEQQNVIMREIQQLLHKELLNSSPEQQQQLLTLQQLLQHNQLKQQQTDSDLVTLEAAMKAPPAAAATSSVPSVTITGSLKPPPPLKVFKKPPAIPATLNCPYCNYQASWNENLIRHICSNHVSTIFACSIPGCHFKTARKDHFSFHVKNHTGENRMRCNFCAYETARPYHMRRHILRKHKGAHATDFIKLGESSSSSLLTSTSSSSASSSPDKVDRPQTQCEARPPIGIATSKSSLAALTGVPAKNVIFTKTFVSVRGKHSSVDDDKGEDDEGEDSADKGHSSGSEEVDHFGDEEVLLKQVRARKEEQEETELDRAAIDMKHEKSHWEESSADEDAGGDEEQTGDSEDDVSDDQNAEKHPSAGDLIELLLQNSETVSRPPPILHKPAQVKGIKAAKRADRLSKFTAASTSSAATLDSGKSWPAAQSWHSVATDEENSVLKSGPSCSGTTSIAPKVSSVPTSTSASLPTQSPSARASVVSASQTTPSTSNAVGDQAANRIMLPNNDQLPEVVSVLVSLHETLQQSGDTFLSQNCPTQCPICPFTSEWKATMKRHILRHLDPSKDLIQCELCSYNTYRSDHMRNHMMRHTGEGYLTCPACPYKTGRKDHMKRHVASCKACKEQDDQDI